MKITSISFVDIHRIFEKENRDKIQNRVDGSFIHGDGYVELLHIDTIVSIIKQLDLVLKAEELEVIHSMKNLGVELIRI